MAIFFEVLKGIFFFLTLLVALFFLRWDVILSKEYYFVVKQIIMPWYLLFCGLMLGYVISHIWTGNKDEVEQKNKIYVKSFIIGIVIGLVLALTYVFV